jgi:hypothetical protein
MIKKLEPTGDLCIKFSDDELNKLGLKEGDKFSYEESEDGILLKKYSTLELDLSEFSRDHLEFLVQESCEKDITVSQVIENILSKEFSKFKNKTA